MGWKIAVKFAHDVRDLRGRSHRGTRLAAWYGMRIQHVVGLGLVVVISGSGCERERKQPPPAPPAATTVPRPAETPATVAPALDVVAVRALFKPLPSRFDTPDNPATPEKISLGRMLYFDPRLSKGQDLACASCHHLDDGGADTERFSKGHKGQLGGRNSPTGS